MSMEPWYEPLSGQVMMLPPTPATTDIYFIYEQAIASAEWLVVHNMGVYPNVTVMDSADTQIEGTVEWVDVNTVRITFQSAVGGRAILS